MGSSSELGKRSVRGKRKPKSICLPFPSESVYHKCMEDRVYCREYLTELFARHPELFPQAMAAGYTLHGFLHSKKQKLTMRRIKLKLDGEQYQLRPSFVMPYMIGRTEEVEKALFLRRWGVPFEALAYVFGQDAMFWYRAYVALGRPSIVGTTIKDPALLPDHLVADEKHTRRKGKRVYVATTVAKDCILGSEVVADAGVDALTKGYQTFHQEAGNLDPNYTPKTVNTDGWKPTQKAWSSLFPRVQIILCFFHSVLKIKNRCKRDIHLFAPLQEKLWHIYHADTLASFAQRIRRFREWVARQQMTESVKEKVGDFCANANTFKKAYHYPGAYRTSNALERLMNYQDRLLYAMQYFHGTNESNSRYARAMALLWNFHPYDRKTQRNYGLAASPFQKLNGFQYHHNWLQNMMIAASIGGWKT